MILMDRIGQAIENRLFVLDLCDPLLFVPEASGGVPPSGLKAGADGPFLRAPVGNGWTGL
jgi:hypothetical protein